MDSMNHELQKQVRSIEKSVTEQIILNFIPHLDSIDLAIDFSFKNDVALTAYLVGLRNAFLTSLRKFGISRIDFEPGDVFNPQLQEAIEFIYNDKIQKKLIFEQRRPAYVYDSIVIRAATVTVVGDRK